MRKVLLALAGAAALLAMPARADSDFGLKAGLFSIENDDSAAKMIGAIYSFDLLGMVGAEVDAMISAADGEAGAADYSVTQVGAHAVVMSPGPFWVKAKAGLAYNSVDAGGGIDGAKVAPSYGLGVGFGIVEIELTRSKGEVDTPFGTAEFDTTLLSVNIKF